MNLLKTKTQIVGHRIWWTLNYNRALQAAIRMGFFCGILASIISQQYSNRGIFADPLAQLVGLAALWTMVPNIDRLGTGNLVRHEEGPSIDLEA